ncbi:hypothetical protein CK507_14605 [Pseudomonas sp. WN033]|nr:hypothetical protein CK507_14605 [Pseudomonas sp. WN033]
MSRPLDAPPLPLLIFAKAPVPGQVKTRLIPALGAEGACALYQHLLVRTLEQTRDWPGLRYLYCAPDTHHTLFAELAQQHNLQLRNQAPGDLGQRMNQALSDHSQGALLIGSDCPVLTTAHVLLAADALHDHDCVILPSEDGGYVLIGQRQPHPAPFRDMSWSHTQVLADTRQRLQEANLSLWLGPTLWDLDDPEDLARWR